MKKIVLALSAFGLALTGTAATAQARDTRVIVTPAASYVKVAANQHNSSNSGQSAQLRSQIAGLDRAIDRAQSRRTISTREAAGLHRDASKLEKTYASYARNGLSRNETQTLQRQINAINARLVV